MVLRSLLRIGFAVSGWGLALGLIATLGAMPIDRHALVTRHDPVLHGVDPKSPLSVGNGAFAFTVDVTGLQTLQERYTKDGIPLETMARWAWHTDPNPEGFQLDDANTTVVTHGKPVDYPTRSSTPAGDWMRRNPHDFPLVQIGFVDAEGRVLDEVDITAIEQRLHLWSGEIVSRFQWCGIPVEVSTVADPRSDGVAVRVHSAALGKKGGLAVRVAFPRGHNAKVKNTPPLDWTSPESHDTTVVAETPTTLTLRRTRDAFGYGVALAWSDGAHLVPETAPHTFRLTAPAGMDVLEFRAGFAAEAAEAPAEWDHVRVAAAAHWAGYWRRGGAIDFSGSTDRRAAELERRVVLSQYLTAIQFGGPVPPSETGLTASSWYGKHHTEMIWWHLAHFALWGRPEFVENGLDWMVSRLPEARALAAKRGLTGARWAKMVGPELRESPGGNPFIVWNQPHPIALAELLYRAEPTPEVLARWSTLVAETAECMGAMLHWDEATNRYVLGPPLWIAQEIHDQKLSQNPGYELEYWAYALEVAQQWRERAGLARRADWDERIAHLSALPEKDGKYVALESIPDTWDNVASRHDHPSFLMSLGQLPGKRVDRATMRRTLDAVLSSWDWETKIWGWDYPMVAMTAARLGDGETAVAVLLKSDAPNNAYSVNGHCPQRGDLALYLPANGSLLSAVALMAAGWDGSSDDAPGFPQDGTWVVRHEGLHRSP